jgi:DUF3048 family protein
MIRSLRPAHLAFAVSSLICVLALAACSGSHHKKQVAPTTTAVAAPPPATTPAPKPKPKPVRTDPLTGGRPSGNPVVAAKIDDTRDGRPQVNIDKANVVYIEQVEGNLTRLVAVFHTVLPSVEPVRSVRSNDPELLSQYGAIGLAASGGGGDALPALDHSVLKASVNDRGGPGFSRDPARSNVGQGDENLAVNLQTVAGGVHAAHAKGIGWTWAAHTPLLAGTPAATSLRTVVGGTAVQFNWSAKLGRYVRIIDGAVQHAADGNVISTPNVIVQFCQGYTNPADVDQAGHPGHFTKSIGHDKVVVYRNGHRIVGTWTRTSLTSGTVLKDLHHRRIPLAPGGAWVALVTDGAQLS